MKKFTALTVSILALLLISSSANAVGTAAGTAITNQAYADYKDTNGNSLPRVYSNTVTTIVSQVAGVDVSPETSTHSAAQGTTTSFASIITNTGNGPDSFDLTAVDESTWTTRIYYDSNANSVRDPGEDTLVTNTGELAADAEYHVIIEVDIPAGTANDSQSATTLTATSVFNNMVYDAGVYTVIVQDAVLTVTKYVVDSPAFKPGDIITYAIEGNNDGSADAENVTITDAIPANTTYVPGSIRIGPVGGTYATALQKTDVSGDDEADYNVTNPGKITIVWGTAKPKPDPSGSGRLYFQVMVNEDIPSGTSISNIANIDYEIAGNMQPTQQSTPASFTVETLPDVDLSAMIFAQSANPSDTVTYAFTVTNTGNAPDVIDLTYTSSSGLIWALWVDANGDGIAGNDGDYLLTDTDGDGKVDVGTLNQNASRAILAVATIAAGSADQSQDILTVTGTSSLDTNVSDSLIFTTTVTAPVLTVTKVVSPEGNQPPGTELTYTVTATNIGTGTGTSVIISDMIPQFTTYVAGSIKTGSTIANLVSRTDATDADGAHFDTGSNAVVSTGSALGATGTLVLQFKVTID